MAREIRELRQIKKAASGGYQIQFIVDGKSYSGFSKDLEEAKKIRDRMEKELNIDPRQTFKSKVSKNKTSFIPGTNELMPPGLTLCTKQRSGYVMYEILVSWTDHTGRSRAKNFYCCRDSTYSLDKMRDAYSRAVEFRKAYEQASLEDKLAAFDPSAFNLKRKKAEKSEEETKA